MTTKTARQARCKQGTLVIADDHIVLRSRRRVPPVVRWMVARDRVAELVPRAGHGVTLGLIIRCADGSERRLDWLLPHDAQRVAVALGYEWSLQLMREMAASVELGADTMPLPLLTRATAPAQTRVVVLPAVATSQEAEPVAPAGAASAKRLLYGSVLALVAARAQATFVRGRRLATRAQPMALAFLAWAGEQWRDGRALRPRRLSSSQMKLLFVALLAALLAVSSTGWLFPGKAASHPITPQLRLVQVYGGQPPVIVTTPTPSPTAGPTEPPFATPVPQPTATPQPTVSLDVQFTCAWATAFVGGQICVHTQPHAQLLANVTYCTGQIVSGTAHGGEWASAPTRGWVQADGNGNYTWSFVPKTRCIGPATVTVTANWQGQSVTRSLTFIVKP